MTYCGPCRSSQKLGGKVRHIGQDTDERNARQRALHALKQRPIEIRHERNHHIRLRPARVLSPVTIKPLHLLRMKQPDDAMHRRQQLFRAQRPPAPQHQVVNILQPKAGDLAEDVNVVEELLQIHHPHVPGALLAANYFAQSIGRAAMSPAGIEEHELNRLHSSRF